MTALLFTLTAGCGKKEEAAKAGGAPGQAQAAPAAAPVETATAKSETVLRLVSVTGSLQALQTVELLPKVSARVVSVAGREGDAVRTGQVVVQLDTADLQRQVAQSQANVASARAQLAQAQTNYQTQLTTSDVAVRDAQEQLRAAQSQLALTKNPQRSQEVLVAENAVKQAQANYDKAKADRERYQTLFKEGATAAITLDQYVTQEKVNLAALNTAKQQLEIAREGGRTEEIRAQEAQVARARQTLRQAQANRSQVAVRRQEIQAAQAAVAQSQAALAVAQQAVADASLRSPINGVISDRKIEPGQLASPGGGSVATIISPETVYYEAEINEQDVPRVRQGQAVQVRLDAYPNKVFTGRVARVFPTGNTTGRVFNARVVLPNGGGSLRSGLFARGQIVVDRLPNSVTVPVEALIRDPEQENRARVFTVDNGVAKERQVTIGVQTQDGRHYVVTGVPAGSQVVVAGQRALKDGASVSAEPSKGTTGETASSSGSSAPATGGGSGTSATSSSGDSTGSSAGASSASGPSGGNSAQ